LALAALFSSRRLMEIYREGGQGPAGTKRTSAAGSQHGRTAVCFRKTCRWRCGRKTGGDWPVNEARFLVPKNGTQRDEKGHQSPEDGTAACKWSNLVHPLCLSVGLLEVENYFDFVLVGYPAPLVEKGIADAKYIVKQSVDSRCFVVILSGHDLHCKSKLNGTQPCCFEWYRCIVDLDYHLYLLLVD